MDEELELEPEEEAAPEPQPAERVAWYRRRAVSRLGVAMVVLLVAGVLSVVLVDEPDADRLDADQALQDEDGERTDRPSRGVTAPSAEVGGREDRVEERSSSDRSSRRSARRGARSGRSGRNADRNHRGNRPDRPGSSPTTPTTSPTTAPPTTVAPGSVVLTPSGAGPLAPVRVSGERACPAGTATVKVVVSATGGPLDGEVLLERTVTPAADGTWSISSLVVPAVASVPEVAWAAVAPTATVAAQCTGGPSYQAASTPLAAVDPAPTQAVEWDGTTATAAVTGCPSAVRLDVYVGSTAPTLDGTTVPAQSVALVLDQSGAVPTWRGSVDPPSAPSGQQRWVSASCLDGVDGRPVWRHHLRALD